MICSVKIKANWKTISADNIFANFPELKKYRINNKENGTIQIKIDSVPSFLIDMHDTFDEYNFSISYDGEDFIMNIVQK